MKAKQICRRCHRLKVVNFARYCEACDARRKIEEAPKKPKPKQSDP